MDRPIGRSNKAPRNKPFNTQTAEQKLLEALREGPGASVAELARAVGGGRSTVAEQLRQLGRAGTLEKDPDGHWRLAGEEPRQADPTSPPSA